METSLSEPQPVELRRIGRDRFVAWAQKIYLSAPDFRFSTTAGLTGPATVGSLNSIMPPA